MNKNDALYRMARECGLTINDSIMYGVEHFAALVAAAEREACARVCDEVDRRYINQAEKCAERIRARGEE